MRKIKYTILVILLISLSISSFPHIVTGLSSMKVVPEYYEIIKKGQLRFLETYTLAHVRTKLDPGDFFYQVINTRDSSPESAKLGFCPESKLTEAWTYLSSPAFLAEFPEDVTFAWGAGGNKEGKFLYALKKSDKDYSGPDQSDIKEIGIRDGMLPISFTKKGSEKWASLTRMNVGNVLAIVVNDQVYSAPVVREAIQNGQCAISGNFNEKELTNLKAALEE